VASRLDQRNLRIRKAQQGDAARLAQLSDQLGYPTTKNEMAKRLSLVLREKKGACFVVVQHQSGEVLGWIHVSATPLLEVAARTEINGLVVDENTRSQGAGRLLLEAAERWARKSGAKSMSVRSNVIRERAHGFYEKNGYEHYKTQKSFRKQLD
jgi:GNAT superfamily N-acetyltransferase